jgi:meso-butanediol dehydrogenase/(S,S)-butanediol dehydrogenase/diacetyl reductase
MRSDPEDAMNNSYDFAGKVTLVTGGGTGIGRSIARAFLDSGATVVVSGRRRDPLVEAVAGRGTAIVSDISVPSQVRELVRRVTDTFGRLDVVVANAAINLPGELDADRWAAMRATNIDGFVELMRLALPELVKTRGNVVAIASVSGIRGDWGQAGYNATKAAMVNLVRSLALDYGERGVRLNAVAPALTLTDMAAHVSSSPAALRAFVERIPLGRPAVADDIAPATLFLASEDAAYVTGAVLPVDGGTSASTGQARVAEEMLEDVGTPVG